MRTKGGGASANSPKVTPSPTPISASSWMANHYQQNQTQKNPNFDTINKLVIQNYAKDLGSGVFYGWDVISAEETDESYLFELLNRENNTLRIYITLGRILQFADEPYFPELMYQCYVHDDNDVWGDKRWFRVDDITYKNFWGIVEEIVDRYQPLPF